MPRRASAFLVFSAWLALASSALSGEGPPGAAPPDDIDLRIIRGKDLGASDIIRAGGLLMPVFLVMSVGVVALALYSALEFRRKKLAPRDLHGEVMAKLSADREGCPELLSRRRGLYAAALRAALAGGHPGAAVSSAAREAVRLRARVGIFAKTAVISVLIGMIGTVTGLMRVFAASAQEEVQPLLVNAAVFRALVSSWAGLALAALSLVFFYLLGGRLEVLLAEAEGLIEEASGELERKPGGTRGA